MALNKDSLAEVAKSFRPYDESYKLIVEEGDIDACLFCLDSDGVWKRAELQWMLEFFLEKEDYEKCSRLQTIMNEHYFADYKKQEDLNKKLRENQK